jgi:WD40 repeat protein
MSVAIPCAPAPPLCADCFSLAVFPSHVSDPQDDGHGVWFASGCSSSPVVQFFSLASPSAAGAPTVKRAVDQPPEPTLELRCDAHRSRGFCCCYGLTARNCCLAIFYCFYSWCVFRAGITAASWHNDATFFASADANGTVVLWKKKTVPSQRRRPSFDASAFARK